MPRRKPKGSSGPPSVRVTDRDEEISIPTRGKPFSAFTEQSRDTYSPDELIDLLRDDEWSDTGVPVTRDIGTVLVLLGVGEPINERTIVYRRLDIVGPKEFVTLVAEWNRRVNLDYPDREKIRWNDVRPWVDEWEERGEHTLTLYYGVDTDPEASIEIFHTTEVAQLVEDGFLDPRDLVDSAMEYAIELRLWKE